MPLLPGKMTRLPLATQTVGDLRNRHERALGLEKYLGNGYTTQKHYKQWRQEFIDVTHKGVEQLGNGRLTSHRVLQKILKSEVINGCQHQPESRIRL